MAIWVEGYSQIDVIDHPQSIIHSIVQFEDGSMKAQMDIAGYEITHSVRINLSWQRFKTDYPRFQFYGLPILN